MPNMDVWGLGLAGAWRARGGGVARPADAPSPRCAGCRIEAPGPRGAASRKQAGREMLEKEETEEAGGLPDDQSVYLSKPSAAR